MTGKCVEIVETHRDDVARIVNACGVTRSGYRAPGAGRHREKRKITNLKTDRESLL
jgi:hypothetical protein